MGNNSAGKFRGCWMFDTHSVDYYLDDSDEIIGIHCGLVRDEIIGVQSGKKVGGFIGNPGVFALTESTDINAIDGILRELTISYSQRIQKWLNIE